MIIIGLLLVMCIGGFVLGVTFAIVYLVNFSKTIKFYTKHYAGVAIGVSSNDELYDWIFSRSTGGIDIKKSEYGITLNGYHFAVDSENLVRASFPQFEGNRIPLERFAKSIEINKLFDRIVKMANPSALIDETVYKKAASCVKLLNASYVTYTVSFLALCIGTIGIAFWGAF